MLPRARLRPPPGEALGDGPLRRKVRRRFQGSSLSVKGRLRGAWKPVGGSAARRGEARRGARARGAGTNGQAAAAAEEAAAVVGARREGAAAGAGRAARAAAGAAPSLPSAPFMSRNFGPGGVAAARRREPGWADGTD